MFDGNPAGFAASTDLGSSRAIAVEEADDAPMSVKTTINQQTRIRSLDIASLYLCARTATSPKPWTFSQISRNDASTLSSAVRNASASMTRGAPKTTSGAPYDGVLTACSSDKPPTA